MTKVTLDVSFLHNIAEHGFLAWTIDAWLPFVATLDLTCRIYFVGYACILVEYHLIIWETKSYLWRYLSTALKLSIHQDVTGWLPVWIENNEIVRMWKEIFCNCRIISSYYNHYSTPLLHKQVMHGCHLLSCCSYCFILTGNWMIESNQIGRLKLYGLFGEVIDVG